MQLFWRCILWGQQVEHPPLPEGGRLRHQGGHRGVLFSRPVDLCGRPHVFHRPRVLQQVLPGHVQGQEVHRQVHEQHQHPQEAKSGLQIGDLLLWWHRELWLCQHQDQHGGLVLQGGGHHRQRDWHWWQTRQVWSLEGQDGQVLDLSHHFRWIFFSLGWSFILSPCGLCLDGLGGRETATTRRNWPPIKEWDHLKKQHKPASILAKETSPTTIVIHPEISRFLYTVQHAKYLIVQSQCKKYNYYKNRRLLSLLNTLYCLKKASQHYCSLGNVRT